MIILDVETTGTDPHKHSLVSIGAIDFASPKEEFYGECRIWDGAHVDPVALQVNGMGEEEIRDENKQSEAELVSNFLSWMETREDIVVGGINPFFDIGFVTASAARGGFTASLSHRIVDLHSITYYHMLRRGITPPLLNRKTNINSDKIMEYVGIPAEIKPHNALNGALWEAEAFSRLIFGKAMFEQFEEFPVPWNA